MATSVPQVTPFGEVAYRIGCLLEDAASIRNEAPEFFVEALQITRRFYEEELKPRANLNRMERDRVNRIGRALELLETHAPQKRVSL